MAKARVFAFWTLLSGILVLISCNPSVYADSITPSAHPQSSEGPLNFSNQAVVHSKTPAGTSYGYGMSKCPEDLTAPMIIEGSRSISLDQLRREQYRYPNQDLTGRMVETATECSPLFDLD